MQANKRAGDEVTTIIGPALALQDAESTCPAHGRPDGPARYDAAIGLHRDQALKELDMDHGVNVTLELPILRTSPDDGTAYDIAGPFSLIATIQLAPELARARG